MNEDREAYLIDRINELKKSNERLSQQQQQLRSLSTSERTEFEHLKTEYQKLRRWYGVASKNLQEAKSELARMKTEKFGPVMDTAEAMKMIVGEMDEAEHPNYWPMYRIQKLA